MVKTKLIEFLVSIVRELHQKNGGSHNILGCKESPLYEDMHLFVNFFKPVRKLVGKTVVDHKTHRNYDRTKTLYQGC